MHELRPDAIDTKTEDDSSLALGHTAAQRENNVPQDQHPCVERDENDSNGHTGWAFRSGFHYGYREEETLIFP